MKRKYHIFQVYNHKGGELNITLNHTKKSLIKELYYIFSEYIDKKYISEMNREELCELIDDNISIYAGSDKIVMQICKVKNNKLILIDIYDFVGDIIEYAKKDEI